MIEDVSSNTGDLKVSFSKYERNDSRELAKDKFMLDFLNDICKDQSIPKNFKKSALYIGSQSSCISLFDHDEAVLPRMKLFLLLSELWRNQMRSYETKTIFTAFVNCFEKQNIKGIREIDQLNKAYTKAHKEGFKSFEEIIKSDKKKLFVNIKLSMGTNDITKFISQCRK